MSKLALAEILFQSKKDAKGSTAGYEVERAKLVRKLNDAGMTNAAILVLELKPSSTDDWYYTFNSQIGNLIGVLNEA